MPKLETVLKRFEEPDEIRAFEKGNLTRSHRGMIIGRATYEPGWKRSVHVDPVWEHRVASSM